MHDGGGGFSGGDHGGGFSHGGGHSGGFSSHHDHTPSHHGGHHHGRGGAPDVYGGTSPDDAGFDRDDDFRTRRPSAGSRAAGILFSLLLFALFLGWVLFVLRR
jgi:hypothetical protein